MGTGSLRARMVWLGGWIGTPLVIGLSALSVLHMSLGMAHAVFEYTIWAMFFVWLIDGAGRGFSGVSGRVLELRPLLYLGQISYGLYVFHPLVIGLTRWTFAQAGRPYPKQPALMFLFLVAGTIAVAACSWHFFERPLNDLKRRFDFRFLTAPLDCARGGLSEVERAVHAEFAEIKVRRESTGAVLAGK